MIIVLQFSYFRILPAGYIRLLKKSRSTCFLYQITVVFCLYCMFQTYMYKPRPSFNNHHQILIVLCIIAYHAMIQGYEGSSEAIMLRDSYKGVFVIYAGCVCKTYWPLKGGEETFLPFNMGPLPQYPLIRNTHQLW